MVIVINLNVFIIEFCNQNARTKQKFFFAIGGDDDDNDSGGGVGGI